MHESPLIGSEKICIRAASAVLRLGCSSATPTQARCKVRILIAIGGQYSAQIQLKTMFAGVAKAKRGQTDGQEVSAKGALKLIRSASDTRRWNMSGSCQRRALV